jgi:uncharacterized protein
MTTSIAPGIVIDNLLHFPTFYRRAMARGLSRREAIHVTYQQLVSPFFSSSLVCGLELTGFYFGDFLHASRFAMEKPFQRHSRSDGPLLD